ncbi:MAG: hypothetical protein ACREIB_13120 [Pseudomonadota bacterium]
MSMIDPASDLFLLFAGISILMIGAGLGLWLAERLAGRSAPRAKRRFRPSPVWSFNGIPAGAMVDTEVSFRQAFVKKLV